MRKNKVTYILNKIYSYTEKNVMSKKDIKRIEEFYRDNHEKYKRYEDFCEADAEIKKLINTLSTGSCEIKKQFNERKALQRGILVECVLMQTLANILKLDNVFDCETESLNNIPKEVKRNMMCMQETAKTGCAARYIYYKKGDEDTIIIQYGGPNTVGDAAIIRKGSVTIIEIKDGHALIKDKDLLYDENGKLIVTDEIRKNFDYFIPFIKEYNRTTNVFDNIGSNYKIMTNSNTEMIRRLLNKCLKSSAIDLLVTLYDDELIAIKKEDLAKTLSDGKTVLDIEGSEIRTSGKNNKKVFTHKYLKKTLEDLGITVDENNVCTVNKRTSSAIGYTKGRGKTKNTRYKITEVFYVNSDRTIKNKKNVTFRVSDIKQLQSSISIHIAVKTSKEQLGSELGYTNIPVCIKKTVDASCAERIRMEKYRLQKDVILMHSFKMSA